MSTTTRSRPRPSRPPRPRMDARMHQRRIEVRREQTRRRRRLVGWLLLVALMVAGAVGITRSGLFAITGVRVDGVGQQRASVVRSTARVAEGQNLVTVDLDEALARTKALPWVADASVVRRPPSTVVITVVPRRPVAILAGPNGSWIVDRNGVAIAEAADQKLPRIDIASTAAPDPGEAIDDPAADNALALYAALPPDVRRALLTVQAAGPRTVRVQLALDRLTDAGGYRPGHTTWVRMGAAGDVHDQVAVLRALLIQLWDARDGVPAEIDVRVPTNPVVIP